MTVTSQQRKQFVDWWGMSLLCVVWLWGELRCRTVDGPSCLWKKMHEIRGMGKGKRRKGGGQGGRRSRRGEGRAHREGEYVGSDDSGALIAARDRYEWRRGRIRNNGEGSDDRAARPREGRQGSGMPRGQGRRKEEAEAAMGGEETRLSADRRQDAPETAACWGFLY